MVKEEDISRIWKIDKISEWYKIDLIIYVHKYVWEKYKETLFHNADLLSVIGHNIIFRQVSELGFMYGFHVIGHSRLVKLELNLEWLGKFVFWLLS